MYGWRGPLETGRQEPRKDQAADILQRVSL